MTHPAPTIEAHALIDWLKHMQLQKETIRIERVIARIRYMQTHGDNGYKGQFR